MEFDQNKQEVVADVPEAVRMAASTRNLTITPLSTDIVPEDEPDDIIAARHIIGSPIANVPSDAETTVLDKPTILTQQQKHVHHRALIMSSSTTALLAALVGYALFIR